MFFNLVTRPGCLWNSGSFARFSCFTTRWSTRSDLIISTWLSRVTDTGESEVAD